LQRTIIHNQGQSEYLIYYDFWRNYNALAGNGTFQSYLFHNVHTYAVPSLIWYLDVTLASGSLKVLHTIVRNRLAPPCFLPSRGRS
jgi:hypothetical protein